MSHRRLVAEAGRVRGPALRNHTDRRMLHNLRAEGAMDLVWGQPGCQAPLSEPLLRWQEPVRATSERLPEPVSGGCGTTAGVRAAHAPSDTCSQGGTALEGARVPS